MCYSIWYVSPSVIIWSTACTLHLFFCICFCSYLDQFISKLLKIKMQRYFLPIHFLLSWGLVSLQPGYWMLFIIIIILFLYQSSCVSLFSLRKNHFSWTGRPFHGIGSIFGWFASCRNWIFLTGWIRYCSISWPFIGSLLHDGRFFTMPFPREAFIYPILTYKPRFYSLKLPVWRECIHCKCSAHSLSCFDLPPLGHLCGISFFLLFICIFIK